LEIIKNNAAGISAGRRSQLLITYNYRKMRTFGEKKQDCFQIKMICLIIEMLMLEKPTEMILKKETNIVLEFIYIK